MYAIKVSEVRLDMQKEKGGEVFPYVLRCEENDVDGAVVGKWVEKNREELNRLVENHGAVLFRGFGLGDEFDFDRFVRGFGYENFAYEESLSNAVRVCLTDRVFTANEAPSSVRIYLHHEMAQTPIYPSKLFFYCKKAAEEGGGTPLCRSDWLLDRLRDERPGFVGRCEENGLEYSLVMPGGDDAGSGMGRSWGSTFGVGGREEAERRMGELGYSWEWLEDGSLRATTGVLGAVREMEDGRKVFFNQLIAAFRGWEDIRNDASKSVRFGDGEAMDVEGVRVAAELADELAVDVAWEAGDVALVDNFLAMHGRNPFEGERKVLASLVA